MIPVGIIASSHLSSNYSAAVLSDSPLMYFRLNEPSGTTAADSSGGGHSGTYVGPTLGVSGLTSDGDKAIDVYLTQYMEVVYFSGMNTSALTVEAIIRLDALPAVAGCIADRRGPGGTGFSNQSWEFRVTPAGQLNLLAFIGSGGVTTLTPTSAPNLSTGVTYHVAVTLSSFVNPNSFFYINGTQYTGSTLAGTVNNGTSAYLVAGADRYGNGGGSGAYGLDGKLDEFAVYGTALSSSRIAAHYAAI